MADRRDTDAYVYLDCPACGKAIFQPFSRGSGPISFVHHGSHSMGCRLIVRPDPTGTRHEIYPLAPNESFEQHLASLHEEAA